MTRNRPTIDELKFKLILLATLFSLCGTVGAGDRPNVIIIVADDLGYADMSFLPQSPGDVNNTGN